MFAPPPPSTHSRSPYRPHSPLTNQKEGPHSPWDDEWTSRSQWNLTMDRRRDLIVSRLNHVFPSGVTQNPPHSGGAATFQARQLTWGHMAPFSDLGVAGTPLPPRPLNSRYGMGAFSFSPHIQVRYEADSPDSPDRPRGVNRGDGEVAPCYRYLIEIHFPGLQKCHASIMVDGLFVTVQLARKIGQQITHTNNITPDNQVQHTSVSAAQFRRSFHLPHSAVTHLITASYASPVLKIRIPLSSPN
eukprot:GHVN01075841.1.p1 GENE.GHVN01075841.1~~GHVN01075841.1.p1  ORF type:complete len:244 (+),score=78.82 GHVN01075841.1:45-776(+)